MLNGLRSLISLSKVNSKDENVHFSSIYKISHSLNIDNVQDPYHSN